MDSVSQVWGNVTSGRDTNVSSARPVIVSPCRAEASSMRVKTSLMVYVSLWSRVH